MEFSVPWVRALDLSAVHLNEDHRALLHRLNALLEALTSKNGLSVMIAANTLRAEAQAHFAAEELLMRLTNYPDKATHGAKHRKLLDGLDELRFRINIREEFTANLGFGGDNGHTSAAMLEASPYLQRWFVPHLTHDDRKLADFLNSHRQSHAEAAADLA